MLAPKMLQNMKKMEKKKEYFFLNTKLFARDSCRVVKTIRYHFLSLLFWLFRVEGILVSYHVDCKNGRDKQIRKIETE